MSSRWTRRARVSVLVAACAVLSACGGGDAFEAVAGDAGMERCVQKAGLSLDGVDDWSPAEQRTFLSDPAALRCASDELSRDELEAAMRSAFDESSPTSVMKVLTTFVERTTGAPSSRARSVGVLLGSLDPGQFDPGWDSFPVRQQLAWTIFRDARGEQPVYEQWLRATPGARESGPAPDVPFFKHLEDARTGTPAAEVLAGVSDLSKLIDQAQEGDLD